MFQSFRSQESGMMDSLRNTSNARFFNLNNSYVQLNNQSIGGFGMFKSSLESDILAVNEPSMRKSRGNKSPMPSLKLKPTVSFDEFKWFCCMGHDKYYFANKDKKMLKLKLISNRLCLVSQSMRSYVFYPCCKKSLGFFTFKTLAIVLRLWTPWPGSNRRCCPCPCSLQNLSLSKKCRLRVKRFLPGSETHSDNKFGGLIWYWWWLGGSFLVFHADAFRF